LPQDIEDFKLSIVNGQLSIVNENRGKAIESSYDWTVPDTPSDSCLVRVKSSNDMVIPDSSDAVFPIVSPMNPILTVIYPNGGETLVVGNTYGITWNSYGAVGEGCQKDAWQECH